MTPVTLRVIDHDCPVPVDKHGSVKVLPHPFFTPTKGSKVKYLNFAITKAIVNIFLQKFCMHFELKFHMETPKDGEPKFVQMGLVT